VSAFGRKGGVSAFVSSAFVFVSAFVRGRRGGVSAFGQASPSGDPGLDRPHHSNASGVPDDAATPLVSE
jgi:hypothetical protein